jgi:SAM-dependent methyltransferase
VVNSPQDTSRELRRLRSRWEAFGREDPLWAVLANPSKRGRRWDVDEFFATGEAEITSLLEQLSALGLLVKRGTALDFGCGVGRLTRALAVSFDRVVGVDVSLAMVEEARRLNPALTFLHNPASDLAILPGGSIDVLYSRLVLQHVPPDLTLKYLHEFGRVLSAGGVGVFQIPTNGPRRSWARRTGRLLLEKLGRRPRDFGGYAIAEATVRQAIEAAGLTTVATIPDSTAAGWEGILYVTTKPGGTEPS